MFGDTMSNKDMQAYPSVIQFLEKADELIDIHPFLYVEIGRTRTTDWMAWLRTKPKEGEGKLLASGQGLTPDEACEAALAELEKQQ